MSGGPVVRAEGLELRYGKLRAVTGLTVEIPRGVALLIGPNGSGKTTLIRAIAGLLKPSRGRLEVLGLDPYEELGRLAGRIMYLPEYDPYPLTVSVGHVVEVLSQAYGSSAVEEAVDLLGLRGSLGKAVGELSHGMRRRLSLVEALASGRELILLDEPYRGLDKASRQVVSRALEALAERGASMIIASHVVPKMPIDYVVIMENGRLVYSGEPDMDRVVCTVVEC